MLPIHIIHQIAQALAAKYPESANDFFRMSEAISLVSAGADIIAAREEVPSDVAYEDAFDDWHDALRYDETVWYEPIVQKQKLNSIYGRSVQDTTHVYQDTDQYKTFMISTYLRNRGYIAELILSGMRYAGRIAACNQDDLRTHMNFNEICDMTMEALDNIFRGE